MNQQHRLAVEIMSECGKSPHEIVMDGDWLEPIDLAEVLNVIMRTGHQEILNNYDPDFVVESDK